MHAANDPYKMAEAFRSRSGIFGEKGDFDRQMAELDQAILNYEKALVPLKQKQVYIEPMVQGLYDERCQVLAERRSWDKALAACGQAIGRWKLVGRSAPSGTALLVRGDIYFQLGNPARAIADYDEIIGLFPRYPAAAKAYHRRGLVHERAGARDQAIADLRQARAMYTRITGVNLSDDLAAVAEARRRLGVAD